MHAPGRGRRLVRSHVAVTCPRETAVTLEWDTVPLSTLGVRQVKYPVNGPQLKVKQDGTRLIISLRDGTCSVYIDPLSGVSGLTKQCEKVNC